MQEADNTQHIPSPLWIRLNFCHHNTLKGKQEFIDELRKEYTVQVRDVWYPAACEGTEFVMQVLAHLEGFKESAIYALELEIVVKCFKRMWNALSKLSETNESYYLTLDLIFDDITIKFHDVCPGNYGSLLRLVSNIPEHIQILKKNHVQNICHISVNCQVPEEYIDQKTYEFDDQNIFQKSMWEVKYDLGCNICYYDSYNKRIMEVECELLLSGAA